MQFCIITAAALYINVIQRFMKVVLRYIMVIRDFHTCAMCRKIFVIIHTCT